MKIDEIMTLLYIDMPTKVVTGRLRGKTLASTKEARELRPTQALVREAIVNVISSYCLSDDFLDFSELNILDIYAGIGTTGIEFLSNGVNSVTFVERHPACIKVLKNNLDKLGISDRGKVFSGTVPRVFNQIANKNSITSFDLIFSDPPFKFEMKEFERDIQGILDNNLLKQGAVLVIETNKPELENTMIERFSSFLQIEKTKKYGDSVVIFAKKL